MKNDPKSPYAKLTRLCDLLEWGSVSEDEILKILDEVREQLRKTTIEKNEDK